MVRSRKGIENSDSDFRLIGGMTFEEIQNCESKNVKFRFLLPDDSKKLYEGYN